VTPIVEGIRKPLFFGDAAGRDGRHVRRGVAFAALALGAWAFTRADDQLVAQL
jgi:ABC-type polysaccharide/polyol phosphate export permease